MPGVLMIRPSANSEGLVWQPVRAEWPVVRPRFHRVAQAMQQPELEEMHSLKTGALILAAAESGGITWSWFPSRRVAAVCIDPVLRDGSGPRLSGT